MKNRRLLFVGGSGDPGGLHVHTADVAHAAASLGIPVKIVSVNRNYFADLLPPDVIDIEHIEKLSYQDLIIKPQRIGFLRSAVWASVLLRHPGCDIVFCRGAFAETPIAELLMARAAGRRIYTIEHSPLAFAWRSMFSKRHYGGVMNACVRRTIVVSSQISQIATTEFGVVGEKLQFCANWVDPMFGVPTAAERRAARKRLELSDDVQVIGYLGRLGPEKHIDVLIEAFATARRHRPTAAIVLVIAGDGWYRSEIERQVRTSGVADQIRLVGWQTDPRAIYHALDLFVLASPLEGFPLGLIEAMATGLPCIAHPMASTLQLIDNGRNGLVSDISTASLLSGRLIELLEADVAMRRFIGDAAARTIATTYSRAARLPAVLQALDISLEGVALPPPFPRTLTYRHAQGRPTAAR